MTALSLTTREKDLNHKIQGLCVLLNHLKVEELDIESFWTSAPPSSRSASCSSDPFRHSALLILVNIARLPHMLVESLDT